MNHTGQSPREAWAAYWWGCRDIVLFAKQIQ